MISKNQLIKMCKDAEKIGKFFLDNPTASDNDIADALNISSSTVQRYLGSCVKKDDSTYYYLMCNIFSIEEIDFIGKQVQKNRLESQIKGGLISQELNDYLKDENGKFQGCSRK